MSKLKQAQVAILNELRRTVELSAFAVSGEGLGAYADAESSTMKIEISRPLPLDCAENCDAVVFENVSVSLKITTPKIAGDNNVDILDAAEFLCARLNNRRLEIAPDRGAIVLAKSNPIEYACDTAATQSVKLKFIIKGVKI